MSAAQLLIWLLVLAYLGSGAAFKQSKRVGTASGAEYVLLGGLLGPHVLGLVTSDVRPDLTPLLTLALGWLGFAMGARIGSARASHWAQLAWSLCLLVFVFAACAGFVWCVLGLLHPVPMLLRVGASLGLGAVSCEMVAQRAPGTDLTPVHLGTYTQRMRTLWSLGPVIAVVALAMSLAWVQPHHPLGAQSPWFASVGLEVALGTLLGLLAALLVNTATQKTETWSIMLGAALLATGLSAKLSASPLLATLVMGAGLRAACQDMKAIHAMLERSVPALRAPALVIAGTLLDMPNAAWSWFALGATVLGRVAVVYALGRALTRGVPNETSPHVWALRMLGTGSATLCVAIAAALQEDHNLGALILLGALCTSALGELMSLVTQSAARNAYQDIAEHSALQANAAEPAP
jgi:hypothetical protein